MRELKRSSVIKEELKVGDEVIAINLTAGEIFKRFRPLMVDILQAEKEVKRLMAEGVDRENMAEAFDFYGKTIINLYQLIFGVENTEKILAFYDGNYDEMATEVTPYIYEVIVPKINEVMKAEKEKAKTKYQGNGKFRK